MTVEWDLISSAINPDAVARHMNERQGLTLSNDPEGLELIGKAGKQGGHTVAMIESHGKFTNLYSPGATARRAGHILKGEYAIVLEAMKELGVTAQSANFTVIELKKWEGAIVEAVTSAKEAEERELLLMSAVAALQLFCQANITGPLPDPSGSPSSLDQRNHAADSSASDNSTGCQINGVGSVEGLDIGMDLISEGDRWATQRLCADGEDSQGKLLLPVHLVYTLNILLAPFGMQGLGCSITESSSSDQDALEATSTALESNLARLPQTWAWWTLRTLIVQQRMLSGLSSSIRSLVTLLVPLIFTAIDTAPLDSSRRCELVVLANLEAALVEQIYGCPTKAADYLSQAQLASGFTAELTGAMGMRTEHQIDPKAQLVVQISRDAARTACEADQSQFLDESGISSDTLQLSADSDSSRNVLERIRFIDSAESSGREEFSPLEQAILLAHGEQQKKSNAKDDMRPWQISAFTDAVLSQSLSRYVLRQSAKLSRIRFERGRSRTKERALMAMEALINSSTATLPTLQTRSCFVYATLLPPRVEMHKEYGEQLVACGLVGAAMEVFEKLELWDNLLVCYSLLEKVPQALALVRRRLEVYPDDAKLMCALGDLTRDINHYKTAWTQSKGRSSRAQRSLSQYYMSKSEHAKAAEHWELALAINPLNPGGWFSLGFCHLKTGNSLQAIQAFTRCTQQQFDNGEAWNNIAAICLQDGKHKEAFSALKEAVKYKRDSWQTWSNFAAAAAKVESYQAAAHAIEQVGNLTQWQKQETEILDTLVTAIEASVKARKEQLHENKSRTGDQILERSVRVALTASANSAAATPAIWGLIARLNVAQGYTDAAKDAFKKQIRALAGTEWQHDLQAFKDYAAALCAAAYFSLQRDELSSDKANKRELSSSRMLLQSFLKAVPEAFQLEEDVLWEVKDALEAILQRLA